MRAIILAGGKGTRLAPFTIAFPKPLIPIGTMPILEIVVRQLQAAGVQRVSMAVGHLAELIEAYFGDGKRWGVKIDYSREENPLGTIGPLQLISDLPETFLVMNGDILTTLNYEKLVTYHLDSQAEVTVACHRRTVNIDYGVLEYDEHQSLTRFREKPVLHYDVSMGVYVINRSALDVVPPNTYCDFPDLLKRLSQQGRPIKVLPSEDYWLDIGRADDYAQASDFFSSHVADFLPSAPLLSAASR